MTRTLLAGLVMSLGVVWSSPGQAVTYWVSPAGSDANACSAIDGDTDPGTYRATIAQGIACVASGDTLKLKAGTYTEGNLGDSLPAGTSWGTATRVQAAEAGVIIRPSSGARILHHTTSRNTYVVWDGGSVGNQWLKLDGLNITSDCVKIEQGADFVRLQDLEIVDCKNQGILTGGSDLEFLRLKIHDIPECTPDCHAYYIGTATAGKGDNILIEGNEISDLQDTNGYGIQWFGDAPDTGGGIVRNNLVHTGNNACMILGAPFANGKAYNNICYGFPWGIRVDAANAEIYHNLVYGITAEAFLMRANNTTFYNNIVDGNNAGGGGQVGMHIYTDNVGGNFKNNLIINNTGGDIQNDDGASPTIADNLCESGHSDCTESGSSADFTNAATKDFTLLSTSDARNAGITVAAVTTDRLGTSRPQGAAYDMGPYEFVETLGPPMLGTVTMASATFLSAPTLGTVTMPSASFLSAPTLGTVSMGSPTFLSAPTLGTVTMP